MSAVEPCWHCATPMEQAACLRDDEGRPYCCHGCREAAAFIRTGGWDAYYQRRTEPAPRPEQEAAAVALDAPAFLSASSTILGDQLETELQVTGLRCAACTWLVERALGAAEGVTDAQVSYGSGRLKLRWDPARTRLSALALRVSALGYRLAPAGEREATDPLLLARFGLAAFAAGNAMLLAIALYLGWFDAMAERHAQLFRYVTLLLATPAVLWSAAPFFRGAWYGLRYRVPTMDLPLALAIGLLYVHGVYAFFVAAEGYLDSLTMLIALLLGGRLVEASTRSRAESAAAHLLAVAPTTARVRRGEATEEVAADTLVAGDVCLVPRGMCVPADGVVIEGTGLVDLSLLTGESEPTEVSVGAPLPAGATLRSGSVAIEVRAAGAKTTLAKMAKLVADARGARPPHLRWTDRIAPYFTLAVLVVSSATAITWTLLGDPQKALEATVAVLVVACPCALALATPSAFAAGLAAAARRGAWVRDADVLLRLSQADRVLLDKTGTLTKGKPTVVAPHDEVLRLAASLERWSAHPIARAILAEAQRRQLPLAPVEEVVETPGVGIEGRWRGQRLELRSARRQGGVELLIDGVSAGVLQLEDQVREDAQAALESLGVPVELWSGDRPEAVARVAASLPLTRAEGGQLPEDKVRAVQEAKALGSRVMFVGDGLNDAPAIAAAHVGVAMQEGTDAAIAAADVVVFGTSLRPVAGALHAGRETVRTLRALAGFSLTYNVVAVTAAALGYVNPLVAAIVMPLSGMVVIVGAATLHWRVPHEHGHRPAAAADLGGGGEHLRLPLLEGRPSGAV